MNREANIDFNLYSVAKDGNIFSKTKNAYLSNENAHPYVLNEFVTKSGVGDSFARHRVIWYFFNGEIPSCMQIDHINGDKKDNRLENLRLATPYDNTHNINTYKNFLKAVKSEEFKKKVSEAVKGRKMTKERYEKCEATMFKTGHKVSEEIRKKISDKNSKPIVQIDNNGNIINWKSAEEASKTLQINSVGITRCCKGGYYDHRRNKWVNSLQYKGSKWMYKEDYDKMQ